MSRVIAWFSCGAASAVAARLAVHDYGDLCEVVYCDTMASEHPDNARFFHDVERWLGRSIRVIKSDEYATVDDVIERTRYMAGNAGARCTVEMKKRPRFKMQYPDDVHVFGFSADEVKRVNDFEFNSPDMILDWILLRHGLTKQDCFAELGRAGIALPVMYAKGYKNNNCIGCVKASSARYWNMIRRDFPEIFDKRARQSREIGCRLTRYKGKRIFLDELPPDYLPADDNENISCGPDCGPQMSN